MIMKIKQPGKEIEIHDNYSAITFFSQECPIHPGNQKEICPKNSPTKVSWRLRQYPIAVFFCDGSPKEVGSSALRSDTIYRYFQFVQKCINFGNNRSIRLAQNLHVKTVAPKQKIILRIFRRGSATFTTTN